MSKGYVYVLSNPAMPGIVKIGRSIHGGQGRADALYRNDTGVALPFELEFECMFDNAIDAEDIAHRALDAHRINPKREFFQIEVQMASECLLRLAARYMGYAFTPDVEVPSKNQKAPDSDKGVSLSLVDTNQGVSEECESGIRITIKLKNETWKRAKNIIGFSDMVLVYLNDCDFVSATDSELILESTVGSVDDMTKMSIEQTLELYYKRAYTLKVCKREGGRSHG